MPNKIKILLWSSTAVFMAVILAGGCEPAQVTKKYYYTYTDDNILLALRRYRTQNPSPDKDPVILCHGLSYNLLFWDLRDDVSLAMYLARAGYDVWSLSLRGAAPSSQPLNSSIRKLVHFNLDPESLLTIQKRIRDLKMLDWSVDDHIRYDVPAAIKFVQSQTQHNHVHWIGHSMGGMIMFAYLQQIPVDEQSGVKSFVAAGVPMVMFHPLSKPMEFLQDIQLALKLGSHIVGSSAPATWGVIFGNINTPRNKLLYNNDNMDGGILRDLFRRAEEEISPSELRQFLKLVESERFQSLDGSIDYTAGLPRIKTPTYFLVGTLDNMATVGAVRYCYRQVGSGQKKFGLFGQVNAYRADYGHNDIFIGKHAREEVYPTILDWLQLFNVDNTKMDNKLLLQPVKPEPDQETK